MRKFTYLSWLITLLLLAPGCSSVTKYIPFYPVHNNQIESISLESTDQSNQNVPVSLDIVFIYQDKAEGALKNLMGPEWFKNKDALLLSYQHDLKIVHLEIVPQTALQTISLPADYQKAIQVILLANYIDAKGQHQADLSQFKKLKIILRKDGYTLQEQSE